MSRTNVRKMGAALCKCPKFYSSKNPNIFFSGTVVKGFLVIGLAYSGCNTAAAIVLLALAVGMHGAVSTGQLAALVDISPNFAGITLGISGMISVVPGFVSPVIVGLLTLDNVRLLFISYKMIL